MVMGTTVPYGRPVNERRKFFFIDDQAVKRWTEILKVVASRKV